MRTQNTLKFYCMGLILSMLCLAGCKSPSWQFIVTGDSRGSDNGVSTAVLSEIAAEIVNKKVDFVLFSGDLVSGYNDQAALECQLKTWRDTMQPVYDSDIAVYVVRGNHDIGRPPRPTAWNNVFTGRYAMPNNGPAGEKNLTYSVEHKNALIIGIDQYATKRRINQAWIDAQLAKNTQPHIFVFGHEPAFSAGQNDCLDADTTVRDALWKSIEKAGGKTYFCGHDHFYDHTRIDNDGDPANDIHQYIAGTAGAPLYDQKTDYKGNNSDYTVTKINHVKQYGYLLVKVTGSKATIIWMQRTGKGVYEAKETCVIQ